MKIFDFLKNINKQKPSYNANDPIPESEKKYYRPDRYYTSKSYEGTPFERKVITFDERKKTTIPSRTGLYVAEILLLEYCTYGKYPNPKTGYPGLWWFAYGIRNVGAVLKSLEERGYIKFGDVKNEINSLKVDELKSLLSQCGFPTNGKKAELVERAIENIDESVFVSMGLEPKYELTELGQTELEENAYIPYMHKHKLSGNDSEGDNIAFSVWTINKLLDRNDKSNWKEVVDKIEMQVTEEIKKRHEESMKRLAVIDPELYIKLKSKEMQADYINRIEERLSGDTNALIDFWESIWNGEGLLYEKSKWDFRLADLYIEEKRYDDAINFCEFMKAKNPNNENKADEYIDKINIMKAKERK